MNQITDHGGEDIVHPSTISFQSTDSSLTKNKNTFNNELNILDKIISTNIVDDELVNDVYDNELRTSSINSNNKKVTPVTLVNVYGGKKNRKIKHEGLKVLIDTGCDSSMAIEKYASSKRKEKESNYVTGSGVLKTKYESEIHFTLPEFSDKKIIRWNFNITDSKDLGYDIIIGRDILIELGISLSFKNKSVKWEGISIPMRDFNRIQRHRLSKYEFKVII